MRSSRLSWRNRWGEGAPTGPALASSFAIPGTCFPPSMRSSSPANLLHELVHDIEIVSLSGQLCNSFDMPTTYHPPVKYSVRIAGHRTSISLEPIFWGLLRAAAERRGIAINTLVAEIDSERIRSETPPGLAGAIRVWLVVNELSPQSATSDNGGALGASEPAPDHQ